MLGIAKARSALLAALIAALAALCATPQLLRATDMPLVPIAPPSAVGLLEPLDRPTSINGRAEAGALLGQKFPRNVDVPEGNPLADPIDFSPAERDLFADAAAGQLRCVTLLDAGLVASGVSSFAAVEEAKSRFAAVQRELNTLDAAPCEQEVAIQENKILHRAALIHQALHRQLLRGGYDANATNLATTLQTGVYNCASATLLFVALAEQYDMHVQAIELPGHVRALVSCGDEQYEIEVTCPVWSQAYRPIHSSSNATSQTVGSVGLPDGGRAVSPLGLVAMFYYNRGIDAFNDRHFATALAINRQVLLLDPDNAIARANLLATVNNWALALCDGGHFAEAERLLVEGQQLAPQHEAFQHNAVHVEQMWNRVRAAATAAQKIGSAMPSL